MNNIFHDFFYQDETGKTHKRYGNVSFDRNFFQSYYTTIAAIIQHPQKKRKCRLLLLSSNTMSSTTSRHLSQIHSAANGIDRILRVPFSWGARYDNVDTMLLHLSRQFSRDMQYKLTAPNIARQESRHEIEILMSRAQAFRELVPALVISPAFRKLAKASAEITRRKEEQRVLRRQKEEDAKLLAMSAMFQRVAGYFDALVADIGKGSTANGLSPYLELSRIVSVPGSLGEAYAEAFKISETQRREFKATLACLIRRSENPDLRVNSNLWVDKATDEVVTSMGVRVPTRSAKAALLLYLKGREKVLQTTINHLYVIRHIDDTTVAIGCHTLPMNNIRALGEFLGVPIGPVKLPTAEDVKTLWDRTETRRTAKTSDSSDLGRD